MFGAGYIEMLAREMTAELQSIRDSILPAQARELVTKGVLVYFGVLARLPGGEWVSAVWKVCPPSVWRYRGPTPCRIS